MDKKELTAEEAKKLYLAKHKETFTSELNNVLVNITVAALMGRGLVKLETKNPLILVKLNELGYNVTNDYIHWV